MRRSFFKKLCIALLILLWIGWAGFIYAAPNEWKEITAIIVILTAAFGLRMWTADRATVKEGGYMGEDFRWPEEKKEPIQSPQRNAGSRPSSGDSPGSETPSSLGPRG